MPGERIAEDLIEKPDVRRRASPDKEQFPGEGGMFFKTRSDDKFSKRSNQVGLHL